MCVSSLCPFDVVFCPEEIRMDWFVPGVFNVLFGKTEKCKFKNKRGWFLNLQEIYGSEESK